MEPAPGLPPDVPEPSYLPHPVHPRTEIRLAGSEPLRVVEPKSEVKSQLEAAWAVVHLPNGKEWQIRSSAVSALTDLEEHHEPTPLRVA